MKYLKIISSIILVITLFISSTNNTIAQGEIINNMFTIEEKVINEESEFFKENIKYPYLKIKENCKSEKVKNTIYNINKEIETYINSFIKDIKAQSEEYAKEYNNELSKDSIKYQYESYSNYNVSYNKNNLLSIPITTYDFTGGAHGMTYLKSFNYDLSTGDILTLKDMFKDNVDYKKIVDDYINSEINKNAQMYFNSKDGFNGINDNQEFYIDDNGIVVYFQVYDIAPYYVGIPMFNISKTEFGKYLKY